MGYITVFYDTFKALCDKNGVSCKKAVLEMGLSNSLPTAWKKRGLTPKGDTLNKIADYFDVSVDYLLGNDQKEKAPVLTKKDERDISRDLDSLMSKLESNGDLMFGSEPMSREAKESLRAAMKLGLEAAKLKNKERFTPKKYRGKE